MPHTVPTMKTSFIKVVSCSSFTGPQFVIVRLSDPLCQLVPMEEVDVVCQILQDIARVHSGYGGSFFPQVSPIA